jgi:hypothetical protein
LSLDLAAAVFFPLVFAVLPATFAVATGELLPPR